MSSPGKEAKADAESKFSEGKAEGKSGSSKNSDCKGQKGERGFDKADLLNEVREFISSPGFENEYERFVDDYYKDLKVLLTMERGAEHPLIFHDIYNKYLAKFEVIIEDFIKDLGRDPKEFYVVCKDILESDEVFGSDRFFIEAVLATTEYMNFIHLMKAEIIMKAK